MRRTRLLLIGLIVAGGFLASQTAHAQGPRFEVTVTNLARGQTFTPVLVASHREGVTLFTLGEPAKGGAGRAGPAPSVRSALGPNAIRRQAGLPGRSMHQRSRSPGSWSLQQRIVVLAHVPRAKKDRILK